MLRETTRKPSSVHAPLRKRGRSEAQTALGRRPTVGAQHYRTEMRTQEGHEGPAETAATPGGHPNRAFPGNLLTHPIGYLESCFLAKNGTPRQPSICSQSRARLRIKKSIFNNPEHSLMGLEKFSHVWILFVFHQNGHLSYKAKVQPPRLNGAKTGVFSTRSPHRPNAIGLTLAKLEKVEGSAMLLSGIDMVHGTPVLDIKPYIADYDAPQDPGEPPGDLPSQDDQQKPTPASLLDGLPGDGDRQQPRSSLEKPECPDDGTSEGKYGTPDDTADARGTWPDPVEPAADPATGSRSHESPRAAEGPCGPDSPEEHLAEEGTAAGRRGAEDAAGLQGSSARGRPVAKGSPSRATGAARRSEVPPWVRAAPAANLAVRFTPHAEMDLGRFSPERAPDVSRTSFKFFRSAEEAKRAIEAVLSADPRSVYRRKLCQDRLFYFTIDIVHVTCWFGDDFAEVLRIKHASEAVQMTDPAESLVAVGS